MCSEEDRKPVSMTELRRLKLINWIIELRRLKVSNLVFYTQSTIAVIARRRVEETEGGSS